jgi:hypothetical protein
MTEILDISQASVFRNSVRKRGSNSAAHNALVKDLLDTCWAFGYFAWNTKVGGAVLPSTDGKRHFYKFGVKGMADICCFVRLRASVPAFMPAWIEAKTGAGEQDEFQVSFQEDVERRGHVYVLCRDSRELDQVFSKLSAIRV